MAFLPNNEQLDAIKARGSILVSAAAGSGKTAVLVERVISRILDFENPVDANRFLIMTFTTAAAAEMKQRISAEISKRLREAPGDAYLLRQKMLLSFAPICTMDSYCLQLVRENFHSLGIQPDFRVADNALLKVLETEAMDEVISAAFEEGSPEFFALTEALGADNAEYNLTSAISKIYEYLRSLPFPEDWMEHILSLYNGPAEDSPWVEMILNHAREHMNSLYGRLNSAYTEIREIIELEELCKSAFEAISILESLIKSSETGYDELLTALSKAKIKFRARSKKLCELPGAESVFCALYAYNETVDALSGLLAAPLREHEENIAMLRPLIKCIFELTKKYTAALDNLKSEKKVLDFADIEYKALQLLAKKSDDEIVGTDIARERSAFFEEVLVDEYQDTNDLQNTIINALSDGGKKLFLVGDVKQCIYQFRKANPENFIKKYQEYPLYNNIADPSKIILKSNYRSRAEICDYVNFLFGLIMSKKAGGLDYSENEKLTPAAEYPIRQGTGTEIHLIACESGEKDSVKLEARQAARYIREMMENPEAVADENNPGKMRPARFSDFALLLRSHISKQGDFAAEFEKQGIPVWMSSPGGFLRAVEIVTVISLLRAADNPTRDLPLAAAMLSPLFGFTNEHLAVIRGVYKDLGLYAAIIKSAENGDEKCADFIKFLGEIRTMAATLPSDELIQKIYDMTGFYALAQAMENGEQRRANLLLLLEYARSFEGSGYRGLSGFLRFIDRLDPKNAGLSLASTASDSGNTVKIMSIHNSKGLQFPICIIASCGSRFNLKDSTAGLVLHEKFGVGLRVINEAARIKHTTLPREAASLGIINAAISEEIRVLYVALTRAKERLVMISSGLNLDSKLTNIANELASDYYEKNAPIDPLLILKRRSFAEFIIMSALLHPAGQELREIAGGELSPVPADFDLTVKYIPAASLDEETDEPAEERIIMPPPDPEIREEIAKRLDYKYPHAAIIGEASKRAASRLTAEEADEDYIFTSRPVFLSGASATPAERGISIHAFMEYADYEKAAENIPEEISRLQNSGFITRKQAELIDINKLEAFFESGLYKRMRAADKLLREHRFLTAIPLGILESGTDETASKEEIIIQGSADCVFIENDEVIVVDYKTDRTNDENKLRAHYAPQLQLYAFAIEKNLRLPVRELLLYSFTLKKTVEIPLKKAGESILAEKH